MTDTSQNIPANVAAPRRVYRAHRYSRRPSGRGERNAPQSNDQNARGIEALLSPAIQPPVNEQYQFTESRRRSQPMPVLPKIVSEADVLELTAVSHSTLWRKRCRGDFPEPQRVGGRSIGWLVEDVSAWLEAQTGTDEMA